MENNENNKLKEKVYRFIQEKKRVFLIDIANKFPEMKDNNKIEPVNVWCCVEPYDKILIYAFSKAGNKVMSELIKENRIEPETISYATYILGALAVSEKSNWVEQFPIIKRVYPYKMPHWWPVLICLKEEVKK